MKPASFETVKRKLAAHGNAHAGIAQNDGCLLGLTIKNGL